MYLMRIYPYIHTSLLYCWQGPPDEQARLRAGYAEALVKYYHIMYAALPRWRS